MQSVSALHATQVPVAARQNLLVLEIAAQSASVVQAMHFPEAHFFRVEFIAQSASEAQAFWQWSTVEVPEAGAHLV